MKNNTRALLIKCGVPQHIIGYKYLGTAIEMVHEDSRFLRGITKELYPGIAKEYNSTAQRVERAMRHAIEISCKNIDLDVSYEIFGFSIGTESGKPTNKHFIAALAEVLQNNDSSGSN